MKISDKDYSIHPVFGMYAAYNDGSIINIYTKEPLKCNKNQNGYTICKVRKNGQIKIYYVHRFVWECFNGIIEGGGEK